MEKVGKGEKHNEFSDIKSIDTRVIVPTLYFINTIYSFIIDYLFINNYIYCYTEF